MASSPSGKPRTPRPMSGAPAERASLSSSSWKLPRMLPTMLTTHTDKLVTLTLLLAFIPALARADDDDEKEHAAGPRRPLTETDAREGKALYVRECAACHGDKGDGQ